jgi:thiol:disulfide interchange protein DsbD
VFKILRGCLGLAFIVCGAFLVHGAIKGDTGGIDWVTVKKEGQLLTQLQKEPRPAVIDFTAEWCSVCKVLDRKTFRTDRVIEKAAGFSMIKIDCTSPTEGIAALTEKYKVTGLPTVIFMDRKGKEIKDLRVTGFVSPSEMIARMDKTESK